MTDQLNIFDRDLDGLDTEEAAVWRIVRERKGPENAIKVDALAWQTGIKDQRVREIVSGLVVRHGKLIGSRTGNPPGYYVITCPDELREHVRSLRHRGIMCLVRAAALSRQSVEDIFKQGRLDLDGL